jgi:hypothetical protein
MKQPGQRLYNALRGSLLHPQWLSDRFPIRSRQSLRALRDSRILDIGSGNSRNIRFTIHGIRHLLQTLGFEVLQSAQHGNSLLVPMQLLNLGLLEGCRAAWQKNPLLGLAAVIAAYPVCLLNNLLALPFTFLPDKGASCFGYFVIAECT